MLANQRRAPCFDKPVQFMFRWLLAQRADINVQDGAPLRTAVGSGHVWAVEELLARRADVQLAEQSCRDRHNKSLAELGYHSSLEGAAGWDRLLAALGCKWLRSKKTALRGPRCRPGAAAALPLPLVAPMLPPQAPQPPPQAPQLRQVPAHGQRQRVGPCGGSAQGGVQALEGDPLVAGGGRRFFKRLVIALKLC